MKILGYIFFTCLGLFIGRLISVSGFEFDRTINPVDVASIFVTIGAAYWISTVLDKQKEDKRSEKDLFLQRSNDISEMIREFSSKANLGTISLTDVTSACKRINTSVDSLYKSLEANNYKCDQVEKSYLLHSVNTIRALLTTTPPHGSVDTEITITAGEITVSGTKLNKLENEFEGLKNRFLNFQIEIIKK